MIDSDVKYVMIMYGFNEADSSFIIEKYNELMELTTHNHSIDDFMSILNYAFNEG